MSSPEAPRTSTWLFRGFTRYVRRYLGRRFDSVWLSRSGGPPQVDGPLIVFANHPSWWDPMFFYLLAGTVYPERRHFGPMDADALRRYPVLRRLGVFGVEEGRRGAAQFLRAGQSALAQSGGTLWITPEGRFTDARTRPLALERGLAHLAMRVPGAVMVPLAMELTFWNESSPAAFLRFGRPISPRAGETPAELTERCARGLERTLDDLAEEVMRREPEAFESMLRGRAGIGGIYDAWRRLRSWARLRPARLEHEPEQRAARPNELPGGGPR